MIRLSSPFKGSNVTMIAESTDSICDSGSNGTAIANTVGIYGDHAAVNNIYSNDIVGSYSNPKINVNGIAKAQNSSYYFSPSLFDARGVVTKATSFGFYAANGAVNTVDNTNMIAINSEANALTSFDGTFGYPATAEVYTGDANIASYVLYAVDNGINLIKGAASITSGMSSTGIDTSAKAAVKAQSGAINFNNFAIYAANGGVNTVEDSLSVSSSSYFINNAADASTAGIGALNINSYTIYAGKDGINNINNLKSTNSGIQYQPSYGAYGTNNIAADALSINLNNIYADGGVNNIIYSADAITPVNQIQVVKEVAGTYLADSGDLHIRYNLIGADHAGINNINMNGNSITLTPEGDSLERTSNSNAIGGTNDSEFIMIYGNHQAHNNISNISDVYMDYGSGQLALIVEGNQSAKCKEAVNKNYMLYADNNAVNNISSIATTDASQPSYMAANSGVSITLAMVKL